MITIDHIRRTALGLGALAALIAGPACAQQPARLDRGAQQQVVDSVAAVLRARYVDEDAAARVGARLRERLAAGAYAADTLPAAFAGALTRDMYAVSQDLHMRLNYEPTREFTLTASGAQGRAPGGGSGGAVRTARIDPRDSATIARANFGYERVERLSGNVGYLKLNEFQPLDYARETAAAAMRLLAGTDAVIIDLRDNYGGSPDHVRLLLSYFFGADSVRLWATGNPRLGIRNEYWSVAELPGPRMAGADLYVLTSGRTASSAETFSYVARQTGRGTVLGERTAGAGIGGARLSVGHGLALFVPQFQVLTGPGFERGGVAPDVALPEDDAPAAAHEMALRRLAERGGSPTVQREREWALQALATRSQPAPSAAQLERYTGAFGTRRVRVQDGGLVMLSANGYETRLAPAGEHVFRADDLTRVRFETDAAGRATALVVEQADGRSARAERVAEGGTAVR
ncbi:MAG TPA: S41 family peptidase [Longimicrobium sp.]|nr:S41 family peptidase [Longimicrobium sp.]